MGICRASQIRHGRPSCRPPTNTDPPGQSPYMRTACASNWSFRVHGWLGQGPGHDAILGLKLSPTRTDGHLPRPSNPSWPALVPATHEHRPTRAIAVYAPVQTACASNWSFRVHGWPGLRPDHDAILGLKLSPTRRDGQLPRLQPRHGRAVVPATLEHESQMRLAATRKLRNRILVQI